LESTATTGMCGGDSLLQKKGIKQLSDLNTGTIVGLIFQIWIILCFFLINDEYIVSVVIWSIWFYPFALIFIYEIIYKKNH
jgi:hypothetical protein